MTPTEKETAQQILDAAARLFAQRGYKATTTRAIAQEAGVNEVTLFRRFGTKLGILQALGASWESGMAGFAVAEMPAAEDTRAVIGALARLEIEQAQRFGAVAMRLALDAPLVPEVAELLGDGPGRNFAGLVEYLEARQAAGDLRGDVAAPVMAEMFFATTSSLVMSRQVLGGGQAPYDLSMEQVIEQIIEVLWNGISAGKEGRS